MTRFIRRPKAKSTTTTTTIEPRFPGKIGSTTGRLDLKLTVVSCPAHLLAEVRSGKLGHAASTASSSVGWNSTKIVKRI